MMKAIWRKIVPHLILLVASTVAIYPVAWVLKIALSPVGGMDANPNPIPESVTFEHFFSLTSQGEGASFGIQFFNSLLVAGATTAISILVSCSAAYGFSRLRFPGREVGLMGLMLTQIFPGVVMMVPLYIILDNLGLLNSHVGLALVYCTTAIPFCTWTLKGYLDTVPKELEEAAVMDGASRWVIFSRIVLPLAKPAIAVTALFSFMTAWNEFVLAATLLNDERLFTLPVALQRYVGEYQTDWGTFAAGAIITSLPVMALFYALQKNLVGGLTAGAVKG